MYVEYDVCWVWCVLSMMCIEYDVYWVWCVLSMMCIEYDVYWVWCTLSMMCWVFRLWMWCKTYSSYFEGFTTDSSGLQVYIAYAQCAALCACIQSCIQERGLLPAYIKTPWWYPNNISHCLISNTEICLVTLGCCLYFHMTEARIHVIVLTNHISACTINKLFWFLWSCSMLQHT